MTDTAAPTRTQVRPKGTNRGRRVGRERLPWPALVLACCAIGFFALPFIGLLWRAPWGDVADVASRSSVREALWLSIKTSSASTAAVIVFGVPLAWLLARVEFRGR
ncbi:MAG: molybdate ABC transporter permease subunit, partial [Acidobacteriota bacterium]